MRKHFIICLILVMAVVMTSCGTRSAEEAFVTDTVPDLILIPLDEEVAAESWTCKASGNYKWYWPSGKNENTVSEAYGPEPTDKLTEEDALHIIIYMPLTEVNVKLEWQGCQPDDVVLAGSWSMEVFDRNPEQDPSDFTLDACLGAGEDGELLLTLYPDAVYDILATWDPAKGRSFGEAHFYIVTEQPDNSEQ